MSTVKASFQTIMAAAEALIQEKGCRQTTLQDIIRHTGMSKGAIYHYVSSKDELFALVLKSRVEQMNAKFAEVVTRPDTAGLGSPLKLIAEGIIRSTNHQDVSNKIFIYLLSQMDNPKIEAMVQNMYQFTLQTCTNWVEVGKLHKVIPAEVDGSKVSEFLTMFMYGMRVNNTIVQGQSKMTAEDLIALMTKALG
jgi:Transcriptional regulator